MRKGSLAYSGVSPEIGRWRERPTSEPSERQLGVVSGPSPPLVSSGGATQTVASNGARKLKPNDPLKWPARAFWLYFSLNGKLESGDFWAAWFAMILVFLPVSWLFVRVPALINFNNQGIVDLFTPLGWSLFLPIGMLGLWMQFALRVKRAHGLGQPWTWALPLVVRAALRLKP